MFNFIVIDYSTEVYKTKWKEHNLNISLSFLTLPAWEKDYLTYLQINNSWITNSLFYFLIGLKTL